MGILSNFRCPSLRAADHRWADADRLVSESYGRHLLNSEQSKKQAWHPDEKVRNLARVLTITNKMVLMPDYEDLRPGDEHYLAAIDLMRDDASARYRHTLECLLLARASDEVIADHMAIEPEVVGLCHDLFFDVRSRLNKYLLIQDLLFAPAMMQGGSKGPVDVERVVAYLCGHEVFLYFRLGLVDESTRSEVYAKMQQGLVANQGLSALLRRSFSYQSTEGVIEHMQQHMLVKAREHAKQSPDETDGPLARVRRGVQAALSHNLKPEIAEEGDPDFAHREESVTQSADRIREVIE